MGSAGMYRQATGGVKLQVPADQAAEARIILSQSWSLPSDEEGRFRRPSLNSINDRADRRSTRPESNAARVPGRSFREFRRT